MARADLDPIRRDRAERVQAAITRVWENRGGETLSITRGARRLEFYRPPGVITGEDGEIIGVDAWVRLYNVNTGAEIRIDPHRRIVNPPTVPSAGVLEVPDPTPEEPGRTRRELVVDAAEAFVEAVIDSIRAAPNPAGWRTAGTVTTVFADASDGYLSSSDSAYATARAGAALAATTGATDLQVDQFSNGSTRFIRVSYVSFDTSAISDSDVVSSVALDLWLTTDSSTTDFTVEARDYDWGATLTTTDWVAGASVSGLPLSASLATSGIGSTGAYKTFTSDPSFTSVTNIKTGIVHLLLHSSRFRNGDAPANGVTEGVNFQEADNTGTTQDPKLTITHAAPIAAPPVFQRRPAQIWRRY